MFGRLTTPLLLFMMILAVPVAAQTQGGLEGTVRDGTGLVVENATVTVSTAAGRVLRTAVTNGEGRYRIDALPSGSVTIAVQSPGFARNVREVVVPADRRLTTDFALHVDALTQTVRVDAPTPDACTHGRRCPRSVRTCRSSRCRRRSR